MILAIDRPRSPPGSVFFVHVVLLADQLALLLGVPKLLKWPFNLVWAVEMAASISSLAITLAMPIRDPLLDNRDISVPFQTPTYRKRSPEDNFSLWHWMTVSWMSPLISTAYRRQLQDEDVWLLPYQFQHDRLHRLFRQVKGSVTLRILQANAPDLFITSGLGIIESATSLIPIVLLKQLLGALEGDDPNIRAAVVYAIFILCTNLVRTQSGVFSLWFSRRCYERSRGEMITMVYEKTLRRKAFTIPSQTHKTGHADEHNADGNNKGDKPASGPASVGKILNLMRNDVYEVAQRFWEFPNLVTRPLNFVLCIVLLWKILGPASLLGILVLILAQTANLFVIRLWVRWETRRREVTDVKLQIISQFIEAIRHLRWYDWQDKWLGRILSQRQKELKYRIITNLFSKGVDVMNQLAASFFPVAAFYAYTVIAKQPLTVDVAFPALNLFNLLEGSLRELPNLVTVLLNAAVAMRRIESFMAEPNKENGHGEDVTPPPADLSIEMRDASFAWPGLSTCVLQGIDLTCEPGLTLVCGKVGSGKTALLQAMLGELDHQGGEKLVPEEMMGYCAQTPWLQSMSIRDNILFCENFSETRYRQVLDACCLVPDLREFQAGDLSMIGENGVGLSGGQKARVALARAVYSRSRILLLDDPIAALDHNTAETIMKRLFSTSGLMKDRLVVFVTHRIDLVQKHASRVVEIREDGTIARIDADELASDGDLLRRVTSADDEQLNDTNTLDGAHDAIPEKFVEEEYRAHGGVMASVYWRYVKAGKLRWWLCIIVCFVAFRVSKVSYFYFLKLWGEAYEHTGAGNLLFLQQATWAGDQPQQTPAHTTEWFDGIDLGLPSPEVDVHPWLFWFAVLAITQLVARTLSDLVLIILTYTAGKKIFIDVMHRVSNATFRFFDITPVGRLMNRVTSDIGTIDGQIAAQIHSVAWFSLNWIAAMVIIASAAPLFVVLALVMTTTFFVIFLRFLPASQSLRRLEMVSLSPLMSNFGTLVEGLTTVRAFRAQRQFQLHNIATTDAFQKMDHFYWSLQAWLQFRFDGLSALSTFALTLTALGVGLSSGTVAFVLAAAANFVSSTHNLCKRYGELQMQFVSVERVVELLDLEQEKEGERDPPAAVGGPCTPLCLWRSRNLTCENSGQRPTTPSASTMSPSATHPISSLASATSVSKSPPVPPSLSRAERAQASPRSPSLCSAPCFPILLVRGAASGSATWMWPRSTNTRCAAAFRLSHRTPCSSPERCARISTPWTSILTTSVPKCWST